jgi:hypothetical protein
MTFQSNKEDVMKFYEDTNEFRTEHRKTYNELLKKINSKKGMSFLNTSNLDDFMSQAFTEFNDFRAHVSSQPLDDSDITYVYDINKKEYIQGFNLPDKQIVEKYHFVGQLIGSNVSLNNGSTCLQGNKNPSLNKKSLKQSYFNKSKTNVSIMESPNPKLTKNCSCCNYCECGTYKSSLINNHYSILETTNQSIWVDDYFNIYLPGINTYLIFNYTKFPLYSFFININKLGLYHNMKNENEHIPIMFNAHCPTDISDFTNFKEFVTGIVSYKTSQDVRDKTKDLFKNILDFYQYDEKYNYFVQFQTLVEKFTLLSPPKISGNSISIDNDATMNEEHKIYAQSQRIKELEILNETQAEELEHLRGERTKFIERDTISIKKVTDYQALLEELNEQLHDEIDKYSILQKEIIGFKNKIIDYSELQHSHDLIQKAYGTVKTELVDKTLKIDTLKTLNNTLIDKHTEAKQKLVKERQVVKEDKETIKQLTLEIVSITDKTKELDNSIKIKDTQIEESAKRIDGLVASMSSKDEPIKDEYQDMLLAQIKEKNEEISSLKSTISKIEAENTQTIKKFNTMKSQVASLINV